MFKVECLTRLLAKFGQHALCALRMKEGDHEVLSAFARSLVDELDTGSFALCERVSYVLYVESYMVYTAATAVLLDELGNGRFGARRLQQFDFHFAYLKESCFYFLVSYFLDAVALAAAEELKERHSLLQRGNSNA